MTQTESNIISVKEAIRIARDYVQHVYEGEPIEHLLLEEVQLSDDEQYWQITYGFDTNREVVEEVNPNAYATVLPTRIHPKYVREYKLVTIRAEDGHIESMTVRKI